MRLSEKTIELNFCADASRRVSGRVIWFGLTQKQEAQAGFDLCTRLGGRLLLFQFKASNKVLKNGRRRFTLDHGQFTSLRKRVGSARRAVFYVFPTVGETAELAASGEILKRCLLLDVSCLSQIGVPRKADGSPRIANRHYADVGTSDVIIRSTPTLYPLLGAADFFDSGCAGAEELRGTDVFSARLEPPVVAGSPTPRLVGAIIN